MKWETVIGLEVHAELSTKTKIFCGCPTAFNASPNTHVCPGCAGMPGTLPALNRSVVEYAMRLGLTLNCNIDKHCEFDRKHYFYPDLPGSYQISQFYHPICRDGFLEINVQGNKKEIRIKQIHMEADAGKLLHGPQGTLMDFNRASMPLLEIVSQPDLRSATEVIAYLDKLREILLYLEVSDCKMEEGSMRADINLSVRREGEELGVRVEMKNINSFKAIERAIEYEALRQIETLEDGGQLFQETRRWDDEKGQSFGMRSKENAQDYLYFPDPDLLPLEIDDAWFSRVRDNLPELAHQKRERYIKDYGISEDEALVLTIHKNISALFEGIAAECKNSNAAVNGASAAIEAAHLLSGEVLRLMNNTNTLPEDLSLDVKKLASLIGFVLDGKINRSAYKKTVEAVFTNNVDPEKYIIDNGLLMIRDDKAVIEAVEKVLEEEKEAAADYRAGKEKIFGFLMGQVMKKLGGKGNPEAAKKILLERLK